MNQVAAEVPRRTAAHFEREIRLVTATATVQIGILKHALNSVTQISLC